MTSVDIAIAGAGPAALSLAAACARQGLQVVCVAPDHVGRWHAAYGAWEDELRGVLATCVDHRWPRVCVWTGEGAKRTLDRAYVRLDTGKVQDALAQEVRDAGVRRMTATAVAVEHGPTGSTVTTADGRSLHARLVVDATGAARALLGGSAEAPAEQVAWGELLEVEGHPFDIDEMVFMDFRPPTGVDPEAAPSFLYAQPLSPTRVFVEETALISRPATHLGLLRRRLDRRLADAGVRDRSIRGVERCRIPMTLPLPDRRQRTLGFGVAAAMVHPATGYQLVRTLDRAPTVAATIAGHLAGSAELDRVSAAAWQSIWPRDEVRRWELYRFGARFLTTLTQAQTERFFTAFFDLPTADWSGFLSGAISSTALAGVMTRVFARLNPALRWQLMRAGASQQGAPLLRAALAR